MLAPQPTESTTKRETGDPGRRDDPIGTARPNALLRWERIDVLMLATMTARPQRSKTQYRPEARDDRHASQGQLVGARSGAAGGTGVAGVIAGGAIEGRHRWRCHGGYWRRRRRRGSHCRCRH